MFEPEQLENKVAAADRGEQLAASPPPPAVIDDSAAWVDAAVHYGGVVRAMLPAHVQPHWTEERLAAVGAQLARCAKHYGWKFGEILNHPGAMLAGAAFPLVWPFLEPYVRAAQEKPAAPAVEAPLPSNVSTIVPVKPNPE